ncbi:hypothetical protein [Spirosoma pomorum]
MAKKKKYPKAPSAKASLETLQKYEKKCKEISAYNAGLERAVTQKKAIRDRVAKMKSK